MYRRIMNGRNKKRHDRDFFSYERAEERGKVVKAIAKKFPDMSRADMERIVDCFYKMMKTSRKGKGRNRPD